VIWPVLAIAIALLFATALVQRPPPDRPPPATDRAP
jgi:hypothetical protein